jgi:hypothetical protein
MLVTRHKQAELVDAERFMVGQRKVSSNMLGVSGGVSERLLNIINEL